MAYLIAYGEYANPEEVQLFKGTFATREEAERAAKDNIKYPYFIFNW